MKATPIVKWAGGKAKLATTIENFILDSLDLSKIKHYVEPFVGGGAMFLYLAQKYDFESITIIDINPELINMYRAIQQCPEVVMDYLLNYEDLYNSLDSLEEKEELFYTFREKFNTNKNSISNSEINVEQAAYFILLNKSCFNGLYRENKSGNFNVPFGKKNKIGTFKRDNILKVSHILSKTTILQGDYSTIRNNNLHGYFFYFDPPYRPITSSSSFTAYSKSGFNDTSQILLAKYCQEIYNKGAAFALSNSDPTVKNSEDMFFDSLYADFKIKRLSASRAISARTAGRGNVSEILVLSH